MSGDDNRARTQPLDHGLEPLTRRADTIHTLAVMIRFTAVAACLIWGALTWLPPAVASAQSGTKPPPPGPSGLAVPRFESLAAKRVNLRAGPGRRYPIVWVFVRKNLPVMVTAEFEFWRRVRDVDGAEGWVHKSLIRGRRFAVVTGAVRTLLSAPADEAPPVARAEPGVVARLLACKGAWCKLEASGHKGWLKRAQIFGALKNEVFE